MTEPADVMLSVVIISHNQCKLLCRCIDSVLNQETTFPIQVIVSDDCSTDGTREMLSAKYQGRIITTYYDSSETPATLTLERASYNRLNGLRLAKGTYLIHIDGDDFFTSKDLFQEMVNVLEANPNCDVCCQNFCWVDEEKLSEKFVGFNNSELLNQDCVITAEDYCNKIGYLPNSCFCVRRSGDLSTKHINEIPYDDCSITARYLNGGEIAVISRCDFVYVRYPRSSFNSISEEHRRILFQPGIQQIILTPSIAGEYLKRNIGIINYISKRAVDGVNIPDDIAAYYKKQPIFLYNKLGTKVNVVNKFRYLSIYLLTYLMQGLHSNNRFLLKLLYRLSIGKPTDDVKI